MSGLVNRESVGNWSAEVDYFAMMVFVCMYELNVCVLYVCAGAVRVEREHGQAERALLVVSTDVQGGAMDPQLTAVLQWIAASIADLSLMQLSHFSGQELQQVRTLVHTVRLFVHPTGI